MNTMVEAPPGDQRQQARRRRRWRPFVILLCVLAVTAAVRGALDIFGSGSAGLVPRTPRELEPGDTVRLAETAATATVPCTIAVADFYQVPAPAPQPRSSVSVVAQGADPTGKHDSARAFAGAIRVAEAAGKAVWIPPGTFLL